MKNRIILIFAFVLATPMMSFKNIVQFEPIAVIELFTSQGCSSCPSADKLLAQTLSDAKRDNKLIIALSFHVDYWNRLGWTDPFSDKKYSQRQSDYASAMQLRSVYTPQMIVNGSTEFVGSNEKELKKYFRQHYKDKKKRLSKKDSLFFNFYFNCMSLIIPSIFLSNSFCTVSNSATLFNWVFMLK